MQIDLDESNSLEESRELIANRENKVNDLSQIITKDSVAAAGIDVDTPIVNAIIGTLTGTLPTNKQNASQKIFECRLCNCSVNSHANFEQHVLGAKHRKKLKDMEIINKLNEELKENEDSSNRTFQKVRQPSVVCEICSLEANSVMQLQIHLSGSEIQPITCQICKVWFNSTLQEREHKKSERHKRKEAIWQKTKDTNPKKSFQPMNKDVRHIEGITKSKEDLADEVS